MRCARCSGRAGHRGEARERDGGQFAALRDGRLGAKPGRLDAERGRRIGEVANDRGRQIRRYRDRYRARQRGRSSFAPGQSERHLVGDREQRIAGLHLVGLLGARAGRGASARGSGRRRGGGPRRNVRDPCLAHGAPHEAQHGKAARKRGFADLANRLHVKRIAAADPRCHPLPKLARPSAIRARTSWSA